MAAEAIAKALGGRKAREAQQAEAAWITNSAGDGNIGQHFPEQHLMAKSDGQPLMLSLLRVASLRAKLVAVDLDSISVALKQGLISLESAIAWLEDLSLFENVVQRSEIARRGRP
jgi:hypothetical protein